MLCELFILLNYLLNDIDRFYNLPILLIISTIYYLYTLISFSAVSISSQTHPIWTKYLLFLYIISLSWTYFINLIRIFCSFMKFLVSICYCESVFLLVILLVEYCSSWKFIAEVDGALMKNSITTLFCKIPSVIIIYY